MWILRKMSFLNCDFWEKKLYFCPYLIFAQVWKQEKILESHFLGPTDIKEEKSSRGFLIFFYLKDWEFRHLPHHHYCFHHKILNSIAFGRYSKRDPKSNRYSKLYPLLKPSIGNYPHWRTSKNWSLGCWQQSQNLCKQNFCSILVGDIFASIQWYLAHWIHLWQPPRNICTHYVQGHSNLEKKKYFYYYETAVKLYCT